MAHGRRGATAIRVNRARHGGAEPPGRPGIRKNTINTVEAATLMNPNPPGEARATAHRVDPKYAPVLIPAIMAIAMSLVMSLVSAIARHGWAPALVPAWLTSFALGVVVAVPTAILVASPVQRLVGHLTGAPRRLPPEHRR